MSSSFYRSADRDDRVGKTGFATFRAGARCVWSFYRPYCIVPFGTGPDIPQVIQMCNFAVPASLLLPRSLPALALAPYLDLHARACE